MKLTVNGEPYELPDQASVRDLIEAQGLGDRPVAVEVNRQVVPRREHPEHRLQDGDAVELVTLVGGG